MSLAASAERKCPIISLASTKGGVGKTTLAYVLATEIARRLAILVPGRVTAGSPVSMPIRIARWPRCCG